MSPEYLLIPLVALLASGLTLFSGFGLGTVLMPVTALFFPLPVAIAMTALVHLANNLFKAGMLGRHAHRGVLLRFGLPAVLAAFAGAWMLAQLASLPTLYAWQLGTRSFEVTPIKAVVGALILLFVLIELSPRVAKLRIDPRFLPLGGLISGFFGGLSGHQGAFRSAFLLKAGLDKQAFIATGVLAAVMVDCARLAFYGTQGLTTATDLDIQLVALTALAAFLGAWLGNRLLQKVTIGFIQKLVAVLLAGLGLGMLLGLV